MLNNRNDKYGFYKDEHGIDEFELSPYQRAFMEYRLEKDTCLYVCMGLRIRGKLNLKKFKATINEVHKEFDAYRTTFIEKDGKIFYKIYNQYDFEFERVEIEGSDPEERYAYAQKDAYEKLREKVDIFNANAARYLLYELGHQDVFLVIIHDHIMSDADTMDVVMNRVMYKYMNLGILSKKQKRSSHEYNQLQRTNCLTEQGKLDLAYWKEQLEGFQPLPLKESRNPIDECADTLYHKEYNRKYVEEKARALGTSAANIFAAACHLSLMNVYGRNDNILSVVSSNRDRKFRNTVGLIVKCLENRIKAEDGEETLAEFVKRVTYKVSENLLHKDAHEVLDLATMYTFFELDVKDIEKPLKVNIWLPQENVQYNMYNLIILAYPERLEFCPCFSLNHVDYEDAKMMCEGVHKIVDLYLEKPETKLKEVLSYYQ